VKYIKHEALWTASFLQLMLRFPPVNCKVPEGENERAEMSLLFPDKETTPLDITKLGTITEAPAYNFQIR